MTAEPEELLQHCIMDFESDWKESLLTKLSNEGHPGDPAEDIRTLFLRLANIRRRRVAAKPRTVHVASELSCPSELQPWMQEIQRIAARGEDLTPHLSTGILKADGQDLLLNDWGIHHFHLKVGPHKSLTGFKDRSGPVLFARVTDSDFFMIAVLNHGSWTNTDLVEIIHRNWPSSISRFKDNSSRGVAWPEPVTAEQRQMLRNSGINTPIQLSDGTIYNPLALGITTAGTNVGVTLEYNGYLRGVRKLPAQVLEVLPSVLLTAAEQGRPMKPPYKLRFQGFHDRGPIILEENSGVQFVIDALSTR